MRTSISIKHFKSILDVELDLGMVNVLIGANGSGKSAILEAIGVLSAAIADRVDDNTLLHRGVRLGTPSLYKSSFKDQERIPLTIELGINWENQHGSWKYNVNLNNPVENPKPAWEYHSEKLERSGDLIFGRSRASKYQLKNFPGIKIDSYKGLFAFLQGIEDNFHTIEQSSDLYNAFANYAIYMPNTATLRGIQPDLVQREPVGLFGGRLTEAFNELLDFDNEMFGQMDLEELFDLLYWTNYVTIGKPTKEILSPSVPVTQKTIRFTDRFMKEGRNELTPYDASEGSLYVLFVLILAMHAKAPVMFAIDNFDQAMNPRLARVVTKIFCEQIIQSQKIAFITTHNPLVLDGLNLSDDRIRLFTVDRNRYGHTKIKRVEVSEKLLKMGEEGNTLSKLWVTGRLGGVPNL